MFFPFVPGDFPVFVVPDIEESPVPGQRESVVYHGWTRKTEETFLTTDFTDDHG